MDPIITQIITLALSTLTSLGVVPFLQAGIVISLVVGFVAIVAKTRGG